MKIKKGFILREIASKKTVEGKEKDCTQYIVVAVGEAAKSFNGVITLNETSAFIWKLLEKGKSTDEIVKEMLDIYDVDKEVVVADVNNILDKLKEAKILND